MRLLASEVMCNRCVSAPQMVMALEGMHRPKTTHPVPSPVPGPAIPLWVWILSSTLILLLLVSTPIITCILRKRAVTQPIGKALGGMSGRKSQSWNNMHCHLLYQGLDRGLFLQPLSHAENAAQQPSPRQK
ncbi:unnamed protein product [Lepidochelys kempii]